MTNNIHNLARLYFGAPLSSLRCIALTENKSHYLKNVLRKSEGDKIRLFNPIDGEFLAKITSVEKKVVNVEIENQLRPPEKNTQDIHLFFSPIKKDRNDMLIEKAVELGVTHFHPVLFARSIVRDIKPDRIHAQIIEAAEQCERLSIPTLAPLKDFRKALSEWDTNIPLFAAIERMDTLNLSQAPLKSAKTGLCIGPEGGVTPEEIEILNTKKFVTPVSLGANILRSETAVFYGLSLISAKYY